MSALQLPRRSSCERVLVEVRPALPPLQIEVASDAVKVPPRQHVAPGHRRPRWVAQTPDACLAWPSSSRLGTCRGVERVLKPRDCMQTTTAQRLTADLEAPRTCSQDDPLRTREEEAARREADLIGVLDKTQLCAAKVGLWLAAARTRAEQLQLEGEGGSLYALAGRLRRSQVPEPNFDRHWRRLCRRREDALDERARITENLEKALETWSAQVQQLAQDVESDIAVLDELDKTRARLEAEASEKRQAKIREEAVIEVPSTAPTSTAPEPTERRQSRRVPLTAEVELDSDTNIYTGFTTDVSKGGLFVATVQYLPIGQEVELRLTLPSGKQIHANGVVRWTREVNDKVPEIFPGLGIEFVDLPPESVSALEAFVGTREPMFWPN